MQYSLALDWGREPWAGVSPRYLTKGYREGACIVDKSEVGCPSREAQRGVTDPAQLQISIHGVRQDGTSKR